MLKKDAKRELSHKEMEHFFRKMLATGKIAEKLVKRSPNLLQHGNGNRLLQALYDKYDRQYETALSFDGAELKLIKKLLARSRT